MKPWSPRPSVLFLVASLLRGIPTINIRKRHARAVMSAVANKRATVEFPEDSPVITFSSIDYCEDL